MPKSPHMDLSRRERQIMYIIYERGKASANEVMERLPDPPSYSAVRAMLRLLEEKGHLEHEQDGPRYIYLPTQPRETVRRSALRHTIKTFYDGSVEQAMAALLDLSDQHLPDETLDELTRLIEKSRKEGR
ncbi:MAG: BlaI/MecI/CopY family transcriptional regulator [Rhodothermales bacterium]